MLVKRRQNLAETYRGSYFKKGIVRRFLDITMVMKVIMITRVMMEIMNSSNYQRVLPIVATK